MPLEAHLPLAAHREHKRRTNLSDILVQRPAAARGTANQQFALAALAGVADVRAVSLYLNGIQKLANALRRRDGVVLGDVVKEAIEVVKDLWGQLDARHAMAH